MRCGPAPCLDRIPGQRSHDIGTGRNGRNPRLPSATDEDEDTEGHEIKGDGGPEAWGRNPRLPSATDEDEDTEGTL